jgi:hypothetical protein
MRVVRSVLAILFGIVSLVALSQGMISLYLAAVHAGPDHVAGVQHAVSLDRFVAMIAANVIAGVAAGFLAGFIARDKPVRHSRLLAALIALLGASTYIGGVRTEGASRQDALVYCAAVLATLVGGHLRQHRVRQSTA